MSRPSGSILCGAMRSGCHRCQRFRRCRRDEWRRLGLALAWAKPNRRPILRMHEDIHCCSGPSGLRPTAWAYDCICLCIGVGVARCHCALSMARRAVFIVFNVFVVFSDCYGSAGDSTVWSIRARATVRKPLFPGAKLRHKKGGHPLSPSNAFGKVLAR